VRLALAQYRELAAFAQFASDLDEATRKQLERGQRVTELMKQRQFNPMSVAEMAVSLFAAENGYLDEIPVEKIQAYEQALLQYMHSDHQPLMDTINSRGVYDDEIQQGLASALNAFKDKGAW
jgi:ATP synthase subunit alpha